MLATSCFPLPEQLYINAHFLLGRWSKCLNRHLVSFEINPNNWFQKKFIRQNAKIWIFTPKLMLQIQPSLQPLTVPLFVCISSDLFFFLFFNIGKTDCYLYTQMKVHSTQDYSEIFNHIMNCDEFNYILNLLEMAPNEDINNNKCSLMDIIFNNTNILGKSKHWSQESIAMHRLKLTIIKPWY